VLVLLLCSLVLISKLKTTRAILLLYNPSCSSTVQYSAIQYLGPNGLRYVLLRIFLLFRALQVDVSDVFASIEEYKVSRGLKIQAWGIANTTLEDVFIRIATDAQAGIALA